MPLIIIAAGVALLLILMIGFKVNGFIALVLVAAVVGFAEGMDAQAVLHSIQNGIGSTLGGLAKAENRPTGCGFYEGMPSFHGHLYGVNGAGVTQEFIAYVLDYEEESGMATLEVRNNFRGHIAAEVFGPTISATRFELQELYDMDGNLLDVAKTPMQKIRTHVPLRLEKDAMIRKVVTRNRSGIY